MRGDAVPKGSEREKNRGTLLSVPGEQRRRGGALRSGLAEMNNVRSIERLNEYELERIARDGVVRGSWHDEYKDSAVVFVGGLDPALTEGDVITIFSQYGEIIDINLPKHTAQAQERAQSQEGQRARPDASSQVGKRRGFGFLLYEDQRSTILAVDNLNGAKVLGKTLRVDHVKDYKHLEKDSETGKMREADAARANAQPQLQTDRSEAGPSRRRSPSLTPPPDIDLDDPMASYIASQKQKRARRGRGDADDDDDLDEEGAGGRSIKPVSRAVREAEKEAKRQRKEERAKIRAQREQKRSDRKGGRGGQGSPGSDREGSTDTKNRVRSSREGASRSGVDDIDRRRESGSSRDYRDTRDTRHRSDHERDRGDRSHRVRDSSR
ncbi:unnamed protein product [Parajaminaea phylloscopi]